jgi:signal transduction histidine kinase
MLKKLRRHLTILFTGTTSFILTVILLMTWIYQGHLESIRQEASFQNHLFELSNKLETDIHFSDEWLARLEIGSHLIVHIEENSVPLFFSGAWDPQTDRDFLIESTKKQALTQKIDTDAPPVTNSMVKSSVMSISGEHYDRYIGIVLILSEKNTYKSLVLLQDITSAQKSYLFQGIFFLLLDILGSLALYLITRMVLRKAMAPIDEYQKKQADFVQAASHELRSPLSVIQTSASAIQQDPEKTIAMTDAIKRECQRAGNLIRNLLLLADADSGAAKKELASIEADALLLQLFEAYEPLCRQKGIHLLLHMPDELLPEVYTERDYLYQILSIFLDNAISHGCSEDGTAQNRLLLSASHHNNHVILSVTDYGCGIADDKKEDIFQRFYRADTSRSNKEHFGLGLSLAARLAPLSKVTIRVSDTPGGGATFQAVLTASRPSG